MMSCGTDFARFVLGGQRNAVAECGVDDMGECATGIVEAPKI